MTVILPRSENYSFLRNPALNPSEMLLLYAGFLAWDISDVVKEISEKITNFQFIACRLAIAAS
jgi:hypothetical protein